MKKYSVSRAYRSQAILILLSACMLTACSKSYYSERRYYRVQKRYGHVLSAPGRANAREFGETIDGLREVLNTCPAWYKAAETQFYIGSLYAARKEYDLARTELNKVLTNHAKNHLVCSRARFLMGRCYEAENDWAAALACYTDVIERYPTTRLGLQAPLYIARYYREHGMPEESMKAFEEALAGYRKIIDSNPYSKSVPVLEDIIVYACAQQGEWERAVRYLESVIDKPVQGRSVYPVQVKLAGLYRRSLKRPGKARELYKLVLVQNIPESVRKNVFLELGRSCAEEGDIAAARRLFETMGKMYPGDGTLCAAARAELETLAGSADREKGTPGTQR